MRPRFPFGKKNDNISDAIDDDPTAWLIQSNFAEFLLLHTVYIKYMILFGYTYYNGCKLYKTMSPNTSMMYQYVSMIIQCTGGGILVPVLLNGIPIPIGQDSYIIIISISFLIHYYFPILRDVTHHSSILYISTIVCYELIRTYVIIKFITMAYKTIPPSEFTSPIFGPIICGIIAGCGSMFLPFNKGLDAIKIKPIPSPVISACISSILYHCVVHIKIIPSSLLSSIQVNISQKVHVLLSIFMIAYHLSYDYHPIKTLSTTKSTTNHATSTATEVPPLISATDTTKKQK